MELENSDQPASDDAQGGGEKVRSAQPDQQLTRAPYHDPAIRETHATPVFTIVASRAGRGRGSSSQSAATSAVCLLNRCLKCVIPATGSSVPGFTSLTPPRSNHVAPSCLAQRMRSHISGWPIFTCFRSP